MMMLRHIFLSCLLLIGATLASAQEQLIKVPTEIDGEVDTYWEAVLTGVFSCDTPDICELYERVSLDTYMGSVISRARANGRTAASVLGMSEEEFDAEFERIRRDNAQWLEARIDRAGWFDAASSGEDADAAAFIILQHSDYDLALQKKALGILMGLLAEGKTDAQNVAYLTDRIARATDMPQAYGTQGKCVGTGQWKPNAMIDPEMVATRRADVGLPPLEAYIAQLSQNCP